MKTQQAVLIISGYNIRAVIAFCRWADRHDVAFHIVASSNTDPILLTMYRARVAFIRSSQELRTDQFAEWTVALFSKHGYKRMLVLPSTEHLNRFLLSHRKTLEDCGCLVPLVDETLYICLSDKQSFATLCSSYGLDIPCGYDAHPPPYPFVAKPRKYLSFTGKQLIPQLINSPERFARFIHEEDEADYFFQEYVPGRSLYLLACLRKNGEAVLFSQENLMQQAHGGSIILASASDFHHTPVASRYISMLCDLKFSGMIMIEIRHDESSGRHCMIEANPRLWGPIQLPIDNGIDLFGTMLVDQGLQVASHSSSSLGNNFYFWSGGIRPEAQPISYHQYSCEQFVRDLPDLWRQDIFLREDTLELHYHEHGTASLNRR